VQARTTDTSNTQRDIDSTTVSTNDRADSCADDRLMYSVMQLQLLQWFVQLQIIGQLHQVNTISSCSHLHN